MVRHTSMRFLFMVSTLLLFSCEKPIQKADASQDQYLHEPDHTSYNIRVVFSDSTRTKAVLQSFVARVNSRTGETTLGDTVIVEFLDDEGLERKAILTADSAQVNDQTKIMTAIGNVAVYSDSTRTSLYTPVLHWDSKAERLFSRGAVRIVSPTETITGVGFESDQYLKNYRIFNVSGSTK